MFDFFNWIFRIEFFIIPISAGLLSRAAIKGKPKKPYVIALISAFIMLLLSTFGMYINDTPERQANVRASLSQTLSTYSLSTDTP